MVDIFIGCGFIAILVLVVSVSTYFALKKQTQKSSISKEILYSFKQDNTNPTITELVEFSKQNKTVDYKIDK